MYIVGTPSKTVTLLASIESRTAWGSKRGISASSEPAADAGVETAGEPEDVEQRQAAHDHVLLGLIVISSSVQTRRLRSRPPWVSSAPFGVPVVPEV